MSANRRLLDLLAGWAQYVDKCVENDPTVDKAVYELESEAIHSLYQDVGRAELTEFDVRLFAMGTLAKALVEGPQSIARLATDPIARLATDPISTESQEK